MKKKSAPARTESSDGAALDHLVDLIADRVESRRAPDRSTRSMPGAKSSPDVPLEPLVMYTNDQLLALVNADSKTLRRWGREHSLKGYRMDYRLKFLGADILRCMLKEGELTDPAALLVGNPVIPVEMIQHLLASMVQQVAKIVEAKVRFTDGSSLPMVSGTSTTPAAGVIHPDLAYQADTFCKTLKIGRSKFYTMQRNGLKVRHDGRVTVVLGADFIEWAKTLPSREAGAVNNEGGGAMADDEDLGEDGPAQD